MSDLNDKVLAVDSDLESMYEEELPEADTTFKRAIQVLVQTLPYDLSLDPTLSDKESESSRDRGIVEAQFGGDDGKRWNIALNWTRQWKDKVPAGYAWIKYRDTEVAIIGPWSTIRTCWKCGLSGWADEKRKIGMCLPHYPCPHCGTKDWFGRIVDPYHFELDAAEFIVRDANKDNYYEELRPRYKPSSEVTA